MSASKLRAAGGKRFPTIKACVFDFIHSNAGQVEYPAIEEVVLKQFPDSAFKRSHWSWYRYQCTKGRFANQFSATEKKNMAAAMRTGGKRSRQKHQHALKKMAGQDQTVAVTGRMLKATRRVIKAALDYENATGGMRKVGITGEVGEVLCCKLMGLRLCIDPRSQGFDAVDRRGKRVQIKTRRSESDGLPRDAGRVSTFSLHEFDYALLVLMTPDYQIAEIWRAQYAGISGLIGKQKRRNPNLASFKRLSECIYDRSQKTRSEV